MAKSTALDEAKKTLAAQRAVVRRLEKEEEEKFMDFWSDLDSYSSSLIKKCLGGALEIDAFSKVIIKRTGVYRHEERYLEYSNAFCPQKRDYRYENAKGDCSYILENDPRKELIEKAILGDDKILIDVGAGFTYCDGSFMSLGKIIMLIFSYYYRLDQDIPKAIQMVKEVLEGEQSLRGIDVVGRVEKETAKYLYDLSQESPPET